MAKQRLNLQPGRIRLRLVQQVDAINNLLAAGLTGPPLPSNPQTQLLGKNYTFSWDGVNGSGGWQSGNYERKLGEESQFTITLPNGAGSDGVLHRERFLLLTDPNYRPGDEWIEIWRQSGAGRAGDLLYVGTPTDWKVDNSTVEISGYDLLWLLKKVRTFAADFWNHSPRDVFEAYTKAWQVLAAEPFDNFTYVASTTLQTTPDGKYQYRNVEGGATAPPKGYPGQIRLAPTAANGVTRPQFNTVATSPVGVGADNYAEHRLEATVFIESMAQNDDVQFGLEAPGLGYIASIQLSFANGVYGATGTMTLISGNSYNVPLQLPQSKQPPAAYRLAIETRGQWVYFYVDGTLAGIGPLYYPADPQQGGSVAVTPTVYAQIEYIAAASTTGAIQVLDFIWRHTQPLAMRGSVKGDYTLPGAPPPSGLAGTYFSDASLKSMYTGNSYLTDAQNYMLWALNPGLLQPSATRLDPTINFGGATNPTSWPNAIASTTHSTRWTGAIYLDLARYDYTFRVTADYGARLYIGKTRYGEALIDSFLQGSNGTLGTSPGGAYTSPSLRSIFGNVSGWYPIVLEHAQNTGTRKMIFEYARSDAPSTWIVVGSDTSGGTLSNKYNSRPALSPTGTFNQLVRFDSHYNQLIALRDGVGYQFTSLPMSLESGEFPARIAPQVRLGRDTEKVIDEIEGYQPASTGSAQDVADSLLADAQGIADPNSQSQLTAESHNWGTVFAHLFDVQEYDTLSDIGVEELLEQRLASLLALRSGSWEQVALQSPGKRELIDTFPLTGALAEFAWEPGDGVRINLPRIGVVDQSARQMIGVARAVVPDGIGPPTITFRQRPRGFRESLMKIQRQALQQARNYQGQLALVSGPPGANNTGAVDNYSRAALPYDLRKVTQATLVVRWKSDTSPWYIEINNVNTNAPVTAVGRYDVSQYLAQIANGQPEMRARLVSGGAGTGQWELALELKVRI